MKLSNAVLFAVATAEVKTLIGQAEEDKKVPHRHPLQRLWRLYQFSEEIIQEHFYDSNMKAAKLDRMRKRIGKWMYLAARQSYLVGSKKCGFYDDTKVHGGPTNDANADNKIEDLAIPEDSEQTQLSTNANEYSPDNLEIYNPRDRRSLFDDDGDELDELVKYNRDSPCTGIRQIMTGFKKWAHRYIGGCGGQAKNKHQQNRADKLYGIFNNGLECGPAKPLWSPKN